MSWHGNVPFAEVVVPILDVAADGVEEALLARPNAIAIVSGHEDITWMHQKRLEMFRLPEAARSSSRAFPPPGTPCKNRTSVKRQWHGRAKLTK